MIPTGLELSVPPMTSVLTRMLELHVMVKVLVLKELVNAHVLTTPHLLEQPVKLMYSVPLKTILVKMMSHAVDTEHAITVLESVLANPTGPELNALSPAAVAMVNVSLTRQLSMYGQFFEVSIFFVSM